MGYWQIGIEIDKKGMLPYDNAGLIRVKLVIIEILKISLALFLKVFGTVVIEKLNARCL